MWDEGSITARGKRAFVTILRGDTCERLGWTSMGQIVKQLGEGTTRYFWYPGEKKEWMRAGFAVGLGAFAFGLLVWWTGSMLTAVTSGTALTSGVLGTTFGR